MLKTSDLFIFCVPEVLTAVFLCGLILSEKGGAPPSGGRALSGVRENAEKGNPMSIENSVVFFPCKDIKETSKFYQEVVGLQLVQVQDAGNECHIFDTGYGYIGFCHYPDGRPIPSGPVGMCISFNCRDEADVDARYEILKERGADIICPPMKQPNFPVYACFIRDPNDYKVEFQRILLPDQELTGGRK